MSNYEFDINELQELLNYSNQILILLDDLQLRELVLNIVLVHLNSKNNNNDGNNNDGNNNDGNNNDVLNKEFFIILMSILQTKFAETNKNITSTIDSIGIKINSQINR